MTDDFLITGPVDPGTVTGSLHVRLRAGLSLGGGFLGNGSHAAVAEGELGTSPRGASCGYLPADSGAAADDPEAGKRQARAGHSDRAGAADPAGTAASPPTDLRPDFSPHSYGFRPGRRAHDAVRRAQRCVQEGRRWVVDVDLERFFTSGRRSLELLFAGSQGTIQL